MKLMSNSKARRHVPRSAKLAAMIPPNHQEYLAKIPRDLLNRVNELRPILELNGSIQVRKEKGRKRRHRLRYRDLHAKDGRVQKAIAIPPEAVPGVQLMLIGFQGTHLQEIERQRARRRTEELWRKQEDGEELGSVPGF